MFCRCLLALVLASVVGSVPSALRHGARDMIACSRWRAPARIPLVPRRAGEAFPDADVKALHQPTTRTARFHLASKRRRRPR